MALLTADFPHFFSVFLKPALIALGITLLVPLVAGLAQRVRDRLTVTSRRSPNAARRRQNRL